MLGKEKIKPHKIYLVPLGVVVVAAAAVLQLQYLNSQNSRKEGRTKEKEKVNRTTDFRKERMSIDLNENDIKKFR